MTDSDHVAKPPKMECQNCGNGIYNKYPLGFYYVHIVGGKHECPSKKHWKKPWKKPLAREAAES